MTRLEGEGKEVTLEAELQVQEKGDLTGKRPVPDPETLSHRVRERPQTEEPVTAGRVDMVR